ncbi:MAG: rod shape-determining protein [Alistipes sp.]|nr:rod shape-determining protein [Alistipes sp.]
MSTQNGLVFGLDIGTRNVVGIVGGMEHNHFKVDAMALKEHDTRAMLDGQIHDIYKVGDTIRAVKYQLEKQLDMELTEVCIAAAGRVLKTVNVHTDYEFDQETRINQEHIYSLDLLGVEKAHEIINDGSSDVKFYCVGNTPTKYYLNGYGISSLEGHKAERIGVDLIATFLPEEVVDGLYEAVSYAGLSVANLTLEPIAAINVAIPEKYRLLNIALIDVGAGTSDICITKSGSVAAYGMIPYAGDEITEVIAQKYLVDFNTADKIKVQASKKKGVINFKDIMGLAQKTDTAEVHRTVDEIVTKIASETSERIKELNGDKAVSAVFIVGGGGKIPGYTEKIAQFLGIPKERVALRGEEVLTKVDFNVEGFKKDSLYVTPVGICINYYTQKNNFIFVQVNGERIKLYDNNRLTVIDALLQAGYPNDLLFPRRGKERNYTVNGKTRLQRGTAGEAAVIKVNGKETNMNAAIEQNDKIEVTESTIGKDGYITIGQLDEFKSVVNFVVNGKNVSCPKFAYVNGSLQSEYYEIQENDSILMENFYTVQQLFEFLDIDITELEVYVNNVPADLDTKVYENFIVETRAWFSDLREENAEQTVSGQEEAVTETKADGQTEETEEAQPAKPILSMNVTVNGTPVILSGKAEYQVVDVFLFYEFDLSTPKGSAVVTKVNGEKVEYGSPVHEGDQIEIYWEQ